MKGDKMETRNVSEKSGEKNSYIHPMKKTKYYPIANKNSKILILGSFPSTDHSKVEVENEKFYYGSRRNRFWHLVVKLFDEKFSSSKPISYNDIKKGSDVDEFVINMKNEDKEAILLKKNIALWDIVAECYSNNGRWPTEDKYIIQSKSNNISKFLKEHKQIQKVLITGLSSRLKNECAKDIEKEFPKLTVCCLPSPTIWVIARNPNNFEKWREMLIK